MAKYSKKASEKVEKALHELKHGELKSGSGKVVKSRKQAIAIGLSEAREAGAKVPKPKKTTVKKSAAKKKVAAKKASRPGVTKKMASKKKVATKKKASPKKKMAAKKK